jgi:hypothetical protein
MQVRHILGMAVFCGAVGAVGGQTVQAQQVSTKFVQLLLSRESKGISTDKALIKTQDRDVRLETSFSGNSRKLVQLLKMILSLQSKIDKTTSKLKGLDLQTRSAVAALTPPNANLTQRAFANGAIIAMLAARPPFGIPPATSSQ